MSVFRMPYETTYHPSRQPARSLQKSTGSQRRLTLHSLAVLLVLTPLFPLSAGAAEPLDRIPADVSAVIRLQAPETTIEDLTAFVNEVQPGAGAVIQFQRGLLGVAISNPTLAGVDQSQDWFIAIDARPAGEPDILLLIPSSDPAELQEAVGSGFQFAQANGWVAYSQSNRLIEQVRDCLDGTSKGFSSQLNDDGADLLNSGHLNLYVNVAELNETYADQLAAAEDQLDQAIDMIAAQVESTNPGVNIQYVWNMYRDIGRATLQTVRDSQSLTVTLSFTDRALRIEELLTVEQDSATGQFFTGQPASDVNLLQSLPEGQTGYMAMNGNPEPLLGWFRDMMTDMLQDEKVRERFLDSLTMIGKARSGTLVTGGGIAPDAEPALRSYSMTQTDPASVMHDAVDALGNDLEYDVGGIRQRLTLQRDAEQIDGQSIHLYRVEQDVPAELDPLGLQDQLYRRLYGPEGVITQRLTFQDDLTLQTMGGGSDAMRQLLSRSPWSDEQLLRARQQFPDQVNLIVLVDLPDFVISMGRLMVESGTLPLPVDASDLANLQVPRSYAGFSVTTEPTKLHARTVIPVETLQGFARMAEFAQQATAPKAEAE